MEISKMVKDAYENGLKHGFYDDVQALENYLKGVSAPHSLVQFARRSFVLEQLSKVCCEVGESVDAIQHFGPDCHQLETELADIVIRVADLAGYLDINLDHAIAEKMKINRSRPYKHGKLC